MTLEKMEVMIDWNHAARRGGDYTGARVPRERRLERP